MKIIREHSQVKHCYEKEFIFNPSIDYLVFGNYIKQSDIHCSLHFTLKSSTVNDEGEQQKVTIKVSNILNHIVESYDLLPGETITLSTCQVWALYIQTFGSSGFATVKMYACFQFFIANPVNECSLISHTNKGQIEVLPQYEDVKCIESVYAAPGVTNVWNGNGHNNCGIFVTEAIDCTLNDSAFVRIKYLDGIERTYYVTSKDQPYISLFYDIESISIYSPATQGICRVSTILKIAYIPN